MLLGHSWGSWPLLGRSGAVLGPLLGQLWSFWGRLGASWAALGLFGVRLGASCGLLGRVLERLGSLLGRFWGVLGVSWARLGCSQTGFGWLKAFIRITHKNRKETVVFQRFRWPRDPEIRPKIVKIWLLGSLGHSYGLLGRSWRTFWPNLGAFWPSWGVFGRSGAVWGASGGRKSARCKRAPKKVPWVSLPTGPVYNV